MARCFSTLLMLVGSAALQCGGSYGEGVVVGARCTPGQLTQYWVEKPNAERFWAQRDELKTP